MCERLSVMQDLAWFKRFCTQKVKFTLFLNLRIPHPPRIRGSHGVLRKFGSEIAKNTPLPWKMKVVQDLGFEVTKNTPSLPIEKGKIVQDWIRSYQEYQYLPGKLLDLCAGSWCVETNHCIPPYILCSLFHLLLYFSFQGCLLHCS